MVWSGAWNGHMVADARRLLVKSRTCIRGLRHRPGSDMERHSIHGMDVNMGLTIRKHGHRRHLRPILGEAAHIVGLQGAVDHIVLPALRQARLYPALAFGAERARIGPWLGIDEHEAQTATSERDLAITFTTPLRRRIPWALTAWRNPTIVAIGCHQCLHFHLTLLSK